MTQLSDSEINDAAREAGISPAELRSALADQASGALVPQAGSGVLSPSPRGVSAANAEIALDYPPEQAVRAVKAQLERQLGTSGHMQASTDADVYDEPTGVVYRIQAQSDGAQGSLVRVDIDATPMRSRRTLMGMGFGASIGLFAIAGLIIPGFIGATLVGGAIGLGALGLFSLVTARPRAIKNARATLAHALIEAETAGPAALPATPSSEHDGYGQRALPPAGRRP